MSELYVRDGRFDVAIVAAPGIELWPSTGVREIAALCAHMGISVGLFGGDDLRVRGVIPAAGTGGTIIIEDAQKRIHRIEARAIVRISPVPELCDPFPGWRSAGFIPLSTAVHLKRASELQWDPCTVVLGTGNRALRFATELLQSGTREVYCVETYAQWGAKRFAGWEVERRRFEMAGGKLIEARPVRLTQKAAMLWELRLQDTQGIRLLEVARVVSAGPFQSRLGTREHPPGSLLFELDQTAGNTPVDDVEGWQFEKERARLLAVKIVRSLLTELGSRRDELEQIQRRARGRLKRYARHQSEPFTPSWQGKWMSGGDARRLRNFSGVPQGGQKLKPLASVECLEEIACQVCQTVCPTQAIQISPRPEEPGRVLSEDLCTACGMCVKACPSEAISIIEEKEDRTFSLLTLPWKGKQLWREGEFAILLNRRGDSLGSARVKVVLPESSEQVQLVQLEVPSHLLWEARGLRKPKAEAVEDEAFFRAIEHSQASESKVEITVNGEKRLVRDQIPVSIALFETGQNRPADALFCKDGSCGLCDVTIDGNKKQACQSQIHRGMALKLESSKRASAQDASFQNGMGQNGLGQNELGDCSLCPCLGISREQITDRMKQGHLRSPEAVLSVTHVGEGKCRGRVCMDPFLRALSEQGIATDGWIDWRFPWSEWTLGQS
ncbi:MAG: 4Fe-4S dicluster domain-containing protein [Bdellovibrionia bacterium]